MNKLSFNYRTLDFEYTLVLEDRKSISATIYPSLNIIIKAPFEASEDDIVKFLKKKYLWLVEQFDFFKKFINRHPKDFISGESILYLGRMYRLVVKASKTNNVKLSAGDLIVYSNKNIYDGKHNKKLIEKWYFEHATNIFNKRLKEVSKGFDDIIVEYPNLTIRKMNKRWGSYQKNNNTVYLNLDLIKSSRKCIDYVIAHELCHIKYDNHSKDFFKLLSSKLPNYQLLKQELEERFL